LDISVGLVPPMLHLAVKSLEINSYKMRLGFNWGFSFSVSPVTFIVRYWNLLHESSVVRLCLEVALKHIKLSLFCAPPTGKTTNFS
jgi:hypothetical protein